MRYVSYNHRLKVVRLLSYYISVRTRYTTGCFSQKGILVNQRLQQLSEEKIPESLTQINISKLHGYFCDLEQ